MDMFEFDPSEEARATEAALRGIDAVSVGFSEQATSTNLNPEAIVPAILQVVYGRYLIEITPEAAVQGLLDTGFTEDQLFCALLHATIDNHTLALATARINRWLVAGNADRITPGQVKETLSSALMKVAMRQRVTAMMTGIVLTGALPSLVAYATRDNS